MIELLFIGASIAIAAGAAGVRRHRRSAASHALLSYAASRRLVFVPAPANPAGASPRVRGTKDGIAYVLDFHRLGADVRTRVSACASCGAASALSVLQRESFSTRAAALRVGSETFDRTYVVTSGVAADTEALRPILALLLVLAKGRSGVWLQSDARGTSISWLGTEADPTLLDAARDATVAIAACRRTESPFR